MTKKILLLAIPALMLAKSVSFQEALNLTLLNNKELKAKKLDIKKSKLDLAEAKGYNYGNLIFNENISESIEISVVISTDRPF